MTEDIKIKHLSKHRSEVICPGCKNVITEKEDMSKVEYVRTKRGTDVFFHTACMEKVWQ